MDAPQLATPGNGKFSSLSLSEDRQAQGRPHSC